MGIEEELKARAKELRATIAGSFKQLGEEREKAEELLRNIDRQAAVGKKAMKRVEQYVEQYSQQAALHHCPDCWVKDGEESPLTTLPSETEKDLFRCKRCGSEYEVDA